MEREFGDVFYVHCPQCGSDFTRHYMVTTFDRRSEDGPVTVTPEGSLPASANPSNRRDGVIIEVTCEEGCPPFQLCIAQHKGHTQVYERRFYP